MTNDGKQGVQPSAETTAAAERRDASWLISPTTVLGVVVGLLLALAMAGGMFWIGDYYVGKSAEQSTEGKPSLSELRAADQRELSSYGWIDQKEGTVRIPIDKAMELVAKESVRDAGPPQEPPDE